MDAFEIIISSNIDSDQIHKNYIDNFPSKHHPYSPSEKYKNCISTTKITTPLKCQLNFKSNIARYKKMEFLQNVALPI
jgi:hypothetical protein